MSPLFALEGSYASGDLGTWKTSLPSREMSGVGSAKQGRAEGGGNRSMPAVVVGCMRWNTTQHAQVAQSSPHGCGPSPSSEQLSGHTSRGRVSAAAVEPTASASSKQAKLVRSRDTTATVIATAWPALSL